MLPGLKALLDTIPSEHRHGWIANPVSINARMKDSGHLGERQAEAYLPRGRFGMMSIS